MNILDELIAALVDKKAERIITIDFKHTHALIDQMVICDVSNPRLMSAVVQNLKDTCVKLGLLEYRMEGNADSDWLLFEVEHIVVSVFLKEARENYNIERLWHEYVVE